MPGRTGALLLAKSSADTASAGGDLLPTFWGFAAGARAIASVAKRSSNGQPAGASLVANSIVSSAPAG
jgi:hypothetical protein